MSVLVDVSKKKSLYTPPLVGVVESVAEPTNFNKVLVDIAIIFHRFIKFPFARVLQSPASSMATSVEQRSPLYGLSLERVKLKEAEPGSPDRDVSCVSVEKDDPLERVQNLVWIKGNTYYKAALDDWEQQRKSLGGKLERREKRAEELTNQVYNLVGFFSVFQGVLLTAVTQLNSQATGTPVRPLCNKVWYPLVLSVLSAVAAVIGIGFKFVDLRRTDKSKRNLKIRLGDVEGRESLLQTRGARFVFKSLQSHNSSRTPTLYWRLFKEIAVIIGLFVFTGFFCLSYFAILCDKPVPQWI